MSEATENKRRSWDEIRDSCHKRIIEQYGRLFTEEEAIKLVDDIRAELRKEEERKNGDDS